MPKGDRTGPLGTGARKARMAGFCSGSDSPGYANATHANDAGMSRRRRNRCWGAPIVGGRGKRRQFHDSGPTASPRSDSRASAVLSSQPEDNIDVLIHRSHTLQAELDALNKRLEALGSNSQKQEEE